MLVRPLFSSDLINLCANMIQISISPKHFLNLQPEIRSEQICDAHKQNIPVSGLIDIFIAF